jgi:hypothetical protein
MTATSLAHSVAKAAARSLTTQEEGGGASGGGGTAPGAHRYWRLYITAPDGSASFMGLTELALRKGDGSSIGAYVSTSNPVYSTFVNASNDFARAFDGNIVDSGWLSATAASPQYVGMDVESSVGAPFSPVEVRYFDIYGSHNAPDASPKDFELQYSDDGVAWSTALAVTGETGWTANELRTFQVF